MLKIIAITGRNRAGKTSLAKHLQTSLELRGNYVEYYPFAQPLKDELIQQGFGKWYLKNKSKRARRLMQAYGDARREINPSYFLDKWAAQVDYAARNGVHFFVSDDLYHWGELKLLCKYAEKGGISVTVVHVQRPSLPPLTEDDYRYDSVREQQEIEEALLSIASSERSLCRAHGPYGAKLAIISPVINDTKTAIEFVNTTTPAIRRKL